MEAKADICFTAISVRTGRVHGIVSTVPEAAFASLETPLQRGSAMRFGVKSTDERWHIKFIIAFISWRVGCKGARDGFMTCVDVFDIVRMRYNVRLA